MSLMKPKNLSEFWKLEAAGNDFVLYFREAPRTKAQLKRDVIEACKRHFGPGADGAIFVYQKQKKWNWSFYNSDGSETDLCGNAARAVALWIHSVGSKLTKTRVGREVVWYGRLGEFRARAGRKRDFWEVTWPLKHTEELPVPEALADRAWALNENGLAGLYLFDVGVPHVVLLGFEDWNEDDRVAASMVFRSHPSLGAAGANVTWVQLHDGRTVTFERGVEKETLACGSGALAAFLGLRSYAEKKGESLLKAELHFPGGTLYLRDEKNVFWLGGPARIVFRGESE